MYPIIVLEGPDGAGKSTLANAIKEVATRHFPQGKHRILHLTYRWKNKMPLYHRAAWNWAVKHAGSGVVVLDRWHLSERVYAAAYRGGTRWPEMSSMYQSMAEAYGAYSVLCLPSDLNRYLDRMKLLCSTREEMYSDGFERLWHLYSQECEWLFPYQDENINYRYAMDETPVLGGMKEMSYLGQAKLRATAERILLLAVTKRGQVANPYHSNRTVGLFGNNRAGALWTSTPKAIYIGDVHPSNEDEYPFVDTGFHHSGAAVYFHKVLQHLGIYPYEWTATNVTSAYKTEAIHGRLEELARSRWHDFHNNSPNTLYSILEPVPVFLLGNTTHFLSVISSKYPYLRDHSIFRFVKVPHPASLRRNGVDPKLAAESYYALDNGAQGTYTTAPQPNNEPCL